MKEGRGRGGGGREERKEETRKEIAMERKEEMEGARERKGWRRKTRSTSG